MSKPAQQLIRRGESTFQELTSELVSLVEARDQNEWEIGRVLYQGRELSYDEAACKRDGIVGNNPDHRFNQWLKGVSTIIVHTLSSQTRLNYLNLFAAFGDRPERVAHIPKSALYELAAPHNLQVRDDVIEAFDGKRPSAKEVKAELLKAKGVAPKPKAAKAAPAPAAKIERALLSLSAVIDMLHDASVDELTKLADALKAELQSRKAKPAPKKAKAKAKPAPKVTMTVKFGGTVTDEERPRLVASMLKNGKPMPDTYRFAFCRGMPSAMTDAQARAEIEQFLNDRGAQ